ncbi:MAG: CHAD domain-containing protein [Bacteroidales bacterium]|nr:CHAD domain-containing protein [Bacteroidales bacterium]
MQERLLDYFAKHCDLFIRNFNLVLSDFDADAIHDMRVAIKRIRAVFHLMERLYPDKFNQVEEEGKLREMFRLSGRMRDAQVQQQLLACNALNLGSTFGEYQAYLHDAENKAIKKFKKFIKDYNAEKELNEKQEKAGKLISSTDPEHIRIQIIQFVNELFSKARQMRAEDEHDESLHEIRRKLKQCHYLLSLFSEDDPDLPKLNTTLKRLDKVNELLGNWHDQMVGMEMLDRFIEKFRKREEAGENRYLLLKENLADNRYLLYKKVIVYFKEKLDI